MSNTPPLRVVIADDSVLLREGVVRLLRESDIDVVGQAGDAEKLLRKVRAHKPDAAIIDVKMPPTHTREGLVAAKQLRAEAPDMAVLILSQYPEKLYTSELLADNASGFGYLMKDRILNVAEFVDALRRVAKGGSAIDPNIVTQMVRVSKRDHVLDDLTERELEVLALMAEGRTNRAIAKKLFISVRAAEKHVGSIFEKLNFESKPDDHRRVLAVLKYLQEGQDSS
ncbi:MAG: response regulator transcription factor [Solirubrobacterales bacterium]